jgi:three-Cys-motif partner protein
MAKDEKYKWNISTGTYPQIDPHSKIKHKIIEDYIRTYITVVMSNQRIPKIGINIIDGFCGGGVYKDDDGLGTHYGSPIIALDTVQQTVAELNILRRLDREVAAKYYFVDIKKDNIDYLRAVLFERGYSHLIDKDVHLLRSRFTNSLPRLITQIKQFKLSQRALFLLDQYAYKDVPFSSIRTIFREVENAEVLLTFNVDSLIDYLSERDENRKALQNIDLEKYIPWDKLPTFKATMRREWQHLIQRFLAEGILKESGAEFMTVFFITPFGSNPRTYWFIHLAKSYRANAVMKEIHWKYGNHFSHSMTPALFVGYDTKRDIQVTDQQNLGFGEEHFFDSVTGKRIEAELSELLPRKIYDQPTQSFGMMMRGMANGTMANESIVREALHMPILCKDIEVFDKDGRTKRRKGSSIKSTDILVPASQRTMFFTPSVTIPRKEQIDSED